jgi:hypothetical protein
VEIRNLIKRADLETRFTGDGPLVGFLSTIDDLQKSGFAGSIRSDETNFFRRIDLK